MTGPPADAYNGKTIMREANGTKGLFRVIDKIEGR